MKMVKVEVSEDAYRAIERQAQRQGLSVASLIENAFAVHKATDRAEVANDCSPRLLRCSEVMRLTGYRRTWVWKMVRDGLFPAPVKIGRTVRWRSEEVKGWIQGLCRSREGR